MRKFFLGFLLILSTLAGGGMAPAQVQRTVQVKVDLDVTHQTMEGFGAAIMGWREPASYRDPAWYDALVNDLGVSMVRIPVPTHMEPVNDDDDPDNFHWSGFRLGSSEPLPTERTAPPTDAEPTHLDRVMKVAMEFQKRGVERFMASLWSPPAFTKTNRNTVQGGHLRMDMTEELAEFLAAFVILSQKNYGINIGALSIQNELLFVQYYDSCVYTPTHIREAVRAVGRKFRREGINTRIMMPEDMMAMHRMIPYIEPTMADPETRDYVGAFCTHRLGEFDDVRRWRDATRQHGLQTWMTETSGHPHNWQGAMRMAGDMRDYIVGGDMSAWVYWMLTDVGSMPDGRPGPKYHAARHFYRFVRPGALRVESSSTDEDVREAAFRHDMDGTVTVVLINRADTPARVVVEVDGLTGAPSYEVVRSTEEAGSVELTPMRADLLELEMPGRSIITLHGRSDAMKTASEVGPWPDPVQVPDTTQKWGNFEPTERGEGFGATRAAEMNILDALESDIAAGRVNAARRDGWTPLHWAVLCTSSQSVRMLLENDADVNRRANDGWTPLHAAASAPFRPDNGNKRLEPDATGAEVLEMLLAAGADVHSVTEDGWTPLMAAAASGHVGWRGDPEDQPRRIRALLEAGADLEATEVNGRTALHWAAWQGHSRSVTVTDTIVAVLIEAGADVHAVDARGRTPLHYAAEMGHDPIVTALVSAGAPAAATDNDGNTPADLARARHLTSTVDALAEASPMPVPEAAPGEEEAGRYGPELMRAARAGDLDRVRELLGRGADIHWRDSDGFRSVDRARDAGHDEIVRLLQQAEQQQER